MECGVCRGCAHLSPLTQRCAASRARPRGSLLSPRCRATGHGAPTARAAPAAPCLQRSRGALDTHHCSIQYETPFGSSILAPQHSSYYWPMRRNGGWLETRLACWHGLSAPSCILRRGYSACPTHPCTFIHQPRPALIPNIKHSAHEARCCRRRDERRDERRNERRNARRDARRVAGHGLL